MSFLDKVKKASKSVVDAGAKTMLKVGLFFPRMKIGHCSCALEGRYRSVAEERNLHQTLEF